MPPQTVCIPPCGTDTENSEKGVLRMIVKVMIDGIHLCDREVSAKDFWEDYRRSHYLKLRKQWDMKNANHPMNSPSFKRIMHKISSAKKQGEDNNVRKEDEAMKKWLGKRIQSCENLNVTYVELHKHLRIIYENDECVGTYDPRLEKPLG